MQFELIKGNSLEVLKTYPDNHFDSVVTDPPYEIGFMGKSWDSTGIAFNVDLWKEVLRVLKPGGHMVAFSGSRTYHRMAVAIEDAGFEIRDQIMWVYGSGFPKSLNVSKAIEGKLTTGSSNTKDFKKLNGEMLDKGNWGIANLQEQQGYRDTNYDNNGQQRLGKLEATTQEAKQWDGWGTALKPAHEPIVLARKPLSEKTVAENVLKWGTGAINIDKCRVGEEVMKQQSSGKTSRAFQSEETTTAGGLCNESIGRWPANFIHDGSEEVLELFPESKSNNTKRNRTVKGSFNMPNDNTLEYSDNGSNARFFYCAKASKKDRNNGLDNFEEKRPDDRTVTGMGSFDEKGVAKQSNHHPTVKPTDLMAYLCRLITPPNGLILDPFNGSGSTGKGAVREGFKYIGIDLSQEYLDISKARIESELNK